MVVHYGIEQQVLRRPETKGVFTEEESHSYGMSLIIKLYLILNKWNSDLKFNILIYLYSLFFI